MALALYRKYRPQKFAEVSGQNHIKLTVQNELKNGFVGHAYLFCGPRGTGKTTMARLLAKAVNCLNLGKDGEPCNECEACRNFAEGKMMDIMEIDAASHTGVDNVRENVINNARFTPNSAKFKVFVIDEVHMLSISAFNALLKLLEEPPAHAIFVLATTEIHKVPLTIISRCQRFDFRRVAFRSLVERLRYIVARERANVDDAVLEMVARQAGGCVRDAESLLGQILSLGDKQIGLDEASLIVPRSNFSSLFDLLNFLNKKDAAGAIVLVNGLVTDGFDLQQFVNEFVEFCRKGLLYKIKSSIEDLAENVGDDKVGGTVELFDRIEIYGLTKIIRQFLRAKDEMKSSPVAQLPIEVAIVELTQAGFSEARVARTVEPIAQLNVAVGAPKTVVAPNKDIGNEKVETEKEVENLAKNEKSVSMDLADMQARWPDFLQHIKKNNYSLSISLSVSFPIERDGERLILGFLYGLQKDRVDNPTAGKLVSEKIREFFGASYEISCIVDPTLKMPQMNGGDATGGAVVDGVLDAFGGEIVA
jgi:DNA polymerase-3 subunit gamma/tau